MTETMAITQILDMLSVDSPDETVAEVMPDKRADAWYYDDLRAVMRDRPAEMPPVHVARASQMVADYPTRAGHLVDLADDGDPMMLGNGHHRLKIAIELGWTEIAATPIHSETE